MAPFIEPDSYIRLRGEDNELWEYRFDGSTCNINYAVNDWDNNTGIVKAILKRKDLLPLLIGINPDLDTKLAKIMKGSSNEKRKSPRKTNKSKS